MQILCQIVELKPYINLLTASTATILNDFELFDILGLRAPYKPSTVPLYIKLHTTSKILHLRIACTLTRARKLGGKLAPLANYEVYYNVIYYVAS